MKKLIVAMSVLTVLLFSGCGDDTSTTTTINNNCCSGDCNVSCDTGTISDVLEPDCNAQCSSDELHSNYYYNVYNRLSSNDVNKSIIHTTVEVIVPHGQIKSVDVLKIKIRKNNTNESKFRDIYISHADMNLSEKYNFSDNSDELWIDLVPNLVLRSDANIDLHYSVHINVFVKDGVSSFDSSDIFDIVEIMTRCSNNVGSSQVITNHDSLLK